METKTFLIDEHKETIFDADKNQEWLTLVKELGLSAQEKLINTDTGILSPLPFPALMDVERTIYNIVFDDHVKYNEYSDEAIPLQCLSAIALCEKEKYFHKIEIWYSRQVKDPLVIGVIFDDPNEAKNTWSWASRKYYKIAQWGDKLKSLKELLPAYIKLVQGTIEQQFNLSTNNLNDEVKKFEFQINALSL